MQQAIFRMIVSAQRRFRPVSLLLCICIATLSSCCTKVDCSQETFPTVKLCFRNVPDSTGYHKLTVIRLKPDTFIPVDSYTNNYAARITSFDPWYQYRQAGWQNYSYAFHLEVPGTEGTVSAISYNMIVEKVDCNQCFPFGDGRADIVTYDNFSLQHKGQTIRDGDTVFVD